MVAQESRRKKLEILRSQLENERSSFISHWRDLSDYILPRRQRFLISDVNKGDRRNKNIINSTATLASRTLRSGMMSGITSPARPWFRLSTPYPELNETQAVKDWLHRVSEQMYTTLLKSNLYNILPTAYADLGAFGTAAIFIEEDFEDVIRAHSFPIGSYKIAKDHRGRVNVFFREFRLTVRQIVAKFGKSQGGKIDWSNFSNHVREQWENGQKEAWIDVCHVIEPNPDFDENKLESKHKRFSSTYYEMGSASNKNGRITEDDENKYLRESGYDVFPVLCPRWEVTGEDVYGTDCPGMSALGDIRQLQLMEKRKAQAIDKMVNPPMTGPSSLRNQKASILPGDITFVDSREGQQGFRPAYEINPRVQELSIEIQRIEARISRSFYEDLFLMLANSDRSQITAREIEERHDEKLLALGPVLEQLNQDLLDPLIDLIFMYLIAQDRLPQAPKELQNVQLKVEYISMMAQAQKLVGISGVERFAAFVGRVAAETQDPTVLDKINKDQMIDVYADMTSVPPGIVRSDEEVEALRADRAKAQQAQAQVQMIREGAGAAKDLSQASLEGDNALTRMLAQSRAGQMVGSA